MGPLWRRRHPARVPASAWRTPASASPRCTGPGAPSSWPTIPPAGWSPRCGSPTTRSLPCLSSRPMAEIRTLIVDDEPLARRGVRQLLAGHPDLVVVGECRNGREALRAFDALAPDLAFLDVQMPGLDGFGVLRECRGRRRR